jgi:four helix bundle protein
MQKSYKDLEVYRLAQELFYKTHLLSKKLPSHELYELGSQIRRSSSSVVSNIVEGYGRRLYKQEFIRFLIFSHASNLETINHLEKIEKLYPEHSDLVNTLLIDYNQLGIKIFNFRTFVQNKWKT